MWVENLDMGGERGGYRGSKGHGDGRRRRKWRRTVWKVEVDMEGKGGYGGGRGHGDEIRHT